MTTFERAAHQVRSMAVTPRPVYTMLALGAGVLVFVITLLLIASMSTAVLSAAAVTSFGWLTGSLVD